jgi:toxin ParE1/3/4
MKVVFLESARHDLDWFKRYYSQIFPDGARQAAAHYKAAKTLLAHHPEIGRQSDTDGLREFTIPRTPFSFVYSIRNDRIEILRLLDGRSDPAAR